MSQSLSSDEVTWWGRLSHRARIALLAAGLCLLALLTLWLGRGAVSEEERVKAVVLQAVGALEDQDLGTLDRIVSQQYRGYVSENHAALMMRTRRVFFVLERISLSTSDWEIHMDETGGEAVVRLQAQVSAVARQGMPFGNRGGGQGVGEGLRTGAEEVRIVLQREDDGKWRIVEVEARVPEI